jgi:hypothetical protein
MSAVWPVARFEDSLRSQSPERMAQALLAENTPFVFRDSAQGYALLRGHISESLSVDSTSVCIIGSALTGFSMSPDNYSRAFGETSDIDVLVVSERLFDAAWSTILKWHYPRRGRRLDTPDRQWMSDRRREVYWGWFVPDRIRYRGLSRPAALDPLRDFSARWFQTFRGLSVHPELSTRDVNGRLYRTWAHAVLYHANGLSQIKSQISDPQRRLP